MKRNSYKIKILSQLKEKHRLFVEELAHELLEEEGKAFDKIEFYIALNQIHLLLKHLATTKN